MRHLALQDDSLLFLVLGPSVSTGLSWRVDQSIKFGDALLRDASITYKATEMVLHGVEEFMKAVIASAALRSFYIFSYQSGS